MTASPTDKLTAYHELHKRWVEKFGADRAWWPEHVYEVNEMWFYRQPETHPAEAERLDDDHALRLVESYARDELRKCDYCIEVTPTGSLAISRNGYVTVYRSYADALTAEIERDET